MGTPLRTVLFPRPIPFPHSNRHNGANKGSPSRRPHHPLPGTQGQREADVSSSMASTLPMAAMFMRNKVIGWVAVVVAIQNWLGESSSQKKNAAMPGYLSVLMSLGALMTSYMHLVIPQPGQK